jgi:plastocyanin domain-containing protein
VSPIGELVAPRENDRQVIEILVSGGYHPDVIEAQAGRPVRLVFRREDDDACSDRVVFSTPRVDRYLAPRSVTVVDLPPAVSGSIRFTCGMGRYRGRIDLVQGDGNARVSRRLTTTAVAVVGIVSLLLALLAAGLAGSTLSALAIGLLAADAVALVILARHGARRAHRHP